MAEHPLNLLIRFLLELAALVSTGIWGWRQGSGWLSYLLMLIIPLILASIWGLFNVKNDRSRSGSAPVPVPGIVRLVIELVFFAFASYTLYDLEYITFFMIFVSVFIIHYIISYDRIIWLVKN